jgi:hypothetical protein
MCITHRKQPFGTAFDAPTAEQPPTSAQLAGGRRLGQGQRIFANPDPDALKSVFSHFTY